MAKFWDHLKYHDDETKKHSITNEEIAFLCELQKEMNTQDHVGQAAPRYWVIRDYKEIFGKELNNPDGYVLVNTEDGCEEVCRFGTAFFGEMMLSKVADYFTKEYSTDFSAGDFESVYDVDTLLEMLEEKGYEEYAVFEYEVIPSYYGFFLTQKAAEKHLRENAHHYAGSATTYAMTAWRNDEADMLYQILEKVDWSLLEV